MRELLERLEEAREAGKWFRAKRGRELFYFSARNLRTPGRAGTVQGLHMGYHGDRAAPVSISPDNLRDHFKEVAPDTVSDAARDVVADRRYA